MSLRADSLWDILQEINRQRSLQAGTMQTEGGPAKRLWENSNRACKAALGKQQAGLQSGFGGSLNRRRRSAGPVQPV